MLSQAADAKAAYDAALAERPDDPVVVRAATAYRLRTGRIQEAVPLLDRIVKREVNSPDADVEWSKRALALILSGSTDYRDFRRAVDLVGLKLDANGVLLPEPDSGRQESVETAGRGARAGHAAAAPVPRRAIQLLEGLQSTDPDDQFILAVLYDADGAVAKEAEVLKQLASLDDRVVKPDYLFQYAQVLLRLGRSDKARLDDAAALIARLERLEKDRNEGKGAFATVELRARLLEAQGDGDQALDLLRSYVARLGAKPEEMLMVIGSLGRQGRFAEAFDLCEKERLWEKCPPEVVGGVCEAMLRGMPMADGQRDRVQAWLKQRHRQEPEAGRAEDAPGRPVRPARRLPEGRQRVPRGAEG